MPKPYAENAEERRHAEAAAGRVLKGLSENPMVALNHAIATAMVHGPGAGLELLKVLDQDGRLNGHHRLQAVRAHLLEMSGDRVSAIAHYREAAGRTTSVPERNYLMAQAAVSSTRTRRASRTVLWSARRRPGVPSG